MYDLNNLSIIGRLGQDPKIETTRNGKQVCSFSIANQSGGKDTPASWFSVSLWEKTANFWGPKLRKGQKVLLMGRITVSEYQTQNGAKMKRINIDANKVELIDNPFNEDGESGQPAPRNAPARQAAPAAAASSDGFQTEDDGTYMDFDPAPGGGEDEVPF